MPLCTRMLAAELELGAEEVLPRGVSRSPRRCVRGLEPAPACGTVLLSYGVYNYPTPVLVGGLSAVPPSGVAGSVAGEAGIPASAAA